MTVHEHFDEVRYIHDHTVGGGAHKHFDVRPTELEAEALDAHLQDLAQPEGSEERALAEARSWYRQAQVSRYELSPYLDHLQDLAQPEGVGIDARPRSCRACQAVDARLDETTRYRQVQGILEAMEDRLRVLEELVTDERP